MKKILVIDNDIELQEIYAKILSKEGFGSIHAYDGEDGLEKLKQNSPDLVILDMELGAKLNGIDVLRKIKKIDKKLPVFVISGKVGMDKDPEIQMSSQVYRFFPKPVPFKELAQAINKVLLSSPASGTKNDSRKIPKDVPTSRWEGRKIGNCHLEKLLGEGSSGVVYQGIFNHKPAAVKILKKNENGQNNTEEVLRMQREATVLATVKHKNIIEVLEFGKNPEGYYFLVMSYFPGKNLENYLKDEYKFSQEETIFVISEVAQAMAVAHDAGLVHRDLKPSNILYNREAKQIKVVDFGLARSMEVNSPLTQKGYILGSPQYMSPEQCQAFELDGRSDIYNLGVTFYELITGEAPFKKDNFMQILWAHVFDAITWPNVFVAAPIKKLSKK